MNGAERERRQAAVDLARDSLRLEGFVIDRAAETIAARFVAGELTCGEMIAALKRLSFIEQHPPTTPAQLVGRLPYLIDPPCQWGSTESWISFRDRTLRPMMEGRPDDPNLRNFLTCTETILTWRATIAAEDRFWAAD